ncbi:CD209 antigen-like protein E isoform X2 [Melanotaenia boesemani]|uniref:CD209 antigen-like protein E isoform X2 n=1 Tax=Melanotaenia boesemani TaxID=1250792 RepID=UPI001C048693|nr:CD209 antigen-like protein E isoform X2 [Melanotaenia boesemani]
MARAVHREQTDISMDYANLPDPSACRRSDIHNEVHLAAPGRKLYKLVALSFAFLCILQVALNVSLRLGFYSLDICNNETEDLDKLRKLADDYFQQGWLYFHPSLYYISLIKKTWQESREDCLQRGADLVIINTKDEQDFTRQFHKFTWIGLNDTTKKGNWKWVDGTPLTKSYWGTGEPNGFEHDNESCVEIRFYYQENSWNDEPCDAQNFWICEKNVYL